MNNIILITKMSGMIHIKFRGRIMCLTQDFGAAISAAFGISRALSECGTIANVRVAFPAEEEFNEWKAQVNAALFTEEFLNMVEDEFQPASGAQ